MFGLHMPEAARDIFDDPFIRALAMMFTAMLVIGAVFYQIVEGWGWVNSFYFCAVTLSTVGYGDLHPTTDLGKIFTIFYCVAGIGIVTTFVSNLAARTAVRIQQRVERRMSERSQRDDG
jgi:hypothetical protein